MIVAIQAAVLVALFCASAFFSSAEMAFFSLSPIHIHRIGRTRPQAARRIEAILSSPTGILSTILIGNTVVNVIAADLGFVLTEHLLPGYGASIAIPAMTILILIFGELAPKRLAARDPARLAVVFLPVVSALMVAFLPARRLMELATRLFERQFTRHQNPMSGPELRTVVDVGQQEGVLSDEESVMIDGIIRLEKIEARDVMTPRVDIVGIDLTEDPATFVAAARKASHRYLPAYRGTLDQVDGFVDVPRFLLSGDADIHKAMLPHFYVPDTAPLDNLLAIFQHEGLRIAVVIDEYGGTAGLLTWGDIVEEIVPDVNAGPGRKQPRIQPLGPAKWLVDASTSLEDVNDELDLHLSSDGADRLAGWVSEQAERFPRTGEVVEAQGCRATVGEIKKHRIRTVILEKVEA